MVPLRLLTLDRLPAVRVIWDCPDGVRQSLDYGIDQGYQERQILLLPYTYTLPWRVSLLHPFQPGKSVHELLEHH